MESTTASEQPAAKTGGRLAFRMREIMAGEHRFVDGAGPPGSHPLSFTLDWGPERLAAYLNPLDAGFMLNRALGEIDVGGLVRAAPCSGELELRYLRDASIVYRLDFSGPDGTAYRYQGCKSDIRPWNLHRTHTTCRGTIERVSDGRLISESTVYFDLRTLPAFLASFRLG